MTDYPRDGQWVRVPPEVARQYVYYGVGGWLVFFLILFIIGLILNVIGLIQQLAELGPLLGRLPGGLRAVITVSWIAEAAQIVWVIVLLVLAFGLRSSFPRLLIGGMIVFFAINIVTQLWSLRELAAIGRAPRVDGGTLLLVVILAAALIGLFIWYFVSSKRVNATYRHRLLAAHSSTEDLLRRPSAAAEPAALKAAAEARLAELKRLREENLIDDAAFEAKQRDILRDL